MSATGPAAVTADDERRRRVIDLAMSRRPDMTAGELHQVLRRLGLRVTSATVVADLDALGYRVEDGDRVARAVGSGPDAVDERGLDTAGGRGRWAALVVPALVVVAVVAALVAIALAVASLVDGDDPGTQDTGAGVVTSTPAPSSPTPSTPAGGADGSAPAEDAPGVAPDVELAFDGEGSLPAPGDLGPWSPGLGGWFLADGAARVDAPGEDEAVTYFAGPTPDQAAEVTLPEASPGAGLAFRVSGDGDYLAWTVSPDGQGVQLIQVEGAVQTILLGPEITTPVAPGVVLGVRAVGTDVELLVGGEVVATTTDAGPQDRMGVGLVAIGTDQVSAFDDLRVSFL